MKTKCHSIIWGILLVHAGAMLALANDVAGTDLTDLQLKVHNHTIIVFTKMEIMSGTNSLRLYYELHNSNPKPIKVSGFSLKAAIGCTIMYDDRGNMWEFSKDKYLSDPAPPIQDFRIILRGRASLKSSSPIKGLICTTKPLSGDTKAPAELKYIVIREVLCASGDLSPRTWSWSYIIGKGRVPIKYKQMK